MNRRRIGIPEKWLHRAFVATLAFKAIFAVAETVAGIGAFFVDQGTIVALARRVTREELFEDPRDLLANYPQAPQDRMASSAPWIESTAFALVRAFGRPLVMKLLSPRGERALEHWSGRQGGLALLFARLIPVIAFNLLNYAAALTHISWWTFLWATGVGILPLTILLSVLGDNVLDMPAWIWLVAVAGTALTWLGLRHWRSGKRGDAAEE